MTAGKIAYNYSRGKTSRANMSYMRKLLLFNFCFLTLFTLPLVMAQAQGFVPCTGVNCGICHIVIMVSRVLNWAGMALGYVAAITLVWAGLKFVTSLGNPTGKEAARQIFVNVLIGYTIVLLAWVVIDTGMRIFVNENRLGPWNDIECADQPGGGGSVR